MASPTTITSTSRRPKRCLPRFPQSAIRVLEEWLLEHCDAPHATKYEQDELKLRTGLKRSQIMNWLANARKRRKLDILRPSPSLPAEAQTSVFAQVAHLHPFERWLFLEPLQQTTELSTIQAAIASGHHVKPNRINPFPLGRTSTSTNWQYFRYTSSCVSSMEIRSYAANIRSVCEEEWPNPSELSPTLSKSARRHRRPGGQAGNSAEPSRRFQCTFCNDAFKKKHDWQRHEKSQHIPLEKWICCPQESVCVDPGTNSVTCAFCAISDPNPEHIKDHGYFQCILRPITERTFYRKDHLRQHLRLMHKSCPMASSMDNWKSVVTSIRSRCGFCSFKFDTWDARVDHLSDHFREGALMRDWKGDWGFDDDVMRILERAALPEKRHKMEAMKTTVRGENDDPLFSDRQHIKLLSRNDLGRNESLNCRPNEYLNHQTHEQTEPANWGEESENYDYVDFQSASITGSVFSHSIFDKRACGSSSQSSHMETTFDELEQDNMYTGIGLTYNSPYEMEFSSAPMDFGEPWDALFGVELNFGLEDMSETEQCCIDGAMQMPNWALINENDPL